MVSKGYSGLHSKGNKAKANIISQARCTSCTSLLTSLPLSLHHDLQPRVDVVSKGYSGFNNSR